MKKRRFSWIAYVIIGLSLLGIISQLITNPISLFTNIIFVIGLSLIVFAIFYFLFFRNRYHTSDEMKKYKRAVKQSKEKYQTNNRFPTTKKQSTRVSQERRKRNRPTHLRVIHGKKSKKRNRANY